MLAVMKTLNHILLACCAMGAAIGLAAADDGAQQLMNRMAGVYKHRFMSGVVVPGKPDEPYQAEDVIEIVPVDADHMYVRADLNFYNGHQCQISGMARFESGRFVYRDPEPPLEKHAPCVLKVGIEKDKLTLSDRDDATGESSCWTHCGARGSLSYDIAMAKRRDIRYIDRLKASRQYKQAVDEREKSGR
jgi:hypothetical protein